METWQAVILGLVEGITEYLPVSSTGHLILASALLGLDRPELRGDVAAFEIVIQGGAILAVVGLYWPRMVQMLRGLIGRDRGGLRLFTALVIAFIPSAVLGLLLGDWIQEHLFHAGPVMAALALGGVYMIVVERWHHRRGVKVSRCQGVEGEAEGVEDDGLSGVTARQALLVGLLQCVALFPGTSRAMMTITGGYFIGLRPRQAAEFSFLLGLPTLSAATLYSLYKNLSEASAAGRPNLFESLGPLPAAVGLVVAALSAAAAVKWLVGFLGRHGLTPFGWYRFLLCMVLLGLWWGGMLHIGA